MALTSQTSIQSSPVRRARRTDYAFTVVARRIADYTFRAAQARVLALMVFTGAVAVSEPRWWIWTLASPAAVGTGLCVGLAHAELRQAIPRNRLIRWAWRSATTGHGRHTVNVSGVLETIGALGLATAATYGIASSGALVALGASICYAVSVASAIFVDPAFYNPRDNPWPLLEPLRTGAGLVLAALAGAVVVPGWAGDDRTAAALVCAAALATSLRVRETDRLLRYAEMEAANCELLGRDLVLAQTHGLSSTLNLAALYARDVSTTAPEVHETVRLAQIRLQQLTALEDLSVTDVDYPESLLRPIRWLTGSRGVHSQASIELDILSEPDHDLARLLVSDLVGNAVKAGAGRIQVRLYRRGDEVRFDVDDDGPPFPAGTWRAERSSLARLGRVLERRGGTLTALALPPDHRPAGGSGSTPRDEPTADQEEPSWKRVRATWTPTDLLP